MTDPVETNVLTVNANGPFTLQGELELAGETAAELELCRCGASGRKPHCDGSHARIGFLASGEPPVQLPEPAGLQKGALVVTPVQNGPLRMTGPLTIRSATGLTVDRATQAWLCRCGASSRKPYCDGTHKRIGFEAPGEPPRRK